MNAKEYREILKKDRLCYSCYGHIKTYITNNGYKIVTHLRRCQYLRVHRWLFILYQLERYVYNRKCVKYGCDISSHLVIGAGLKIDHPTGIVINSQTIIGENFNIKGGAVIGKNHRGVPIIGNSVSIGVHALIIGAVTIGDGAEIGAGAIVTHNVPNYAVVVCDSAHILRIKVE